MKPENCSLKLLLAMVLIVLFLPACTAPIAAPTAITTLATEATETPLSLPTPSPSPTVPAGQIRPSAIAGSWYPDDAGELAAMVDGMLASVRPVDGEPIGLIAPHAGYIYSGPVAAYGFKQLEGVGYDVAVIIASDHQAPLSASISVWAEGGFETPLGVAPVDVELAQALVDADPRIIFDPATHEGEHPIEIELPFLQRVCPACRIVPVLMGADDEETVQVLADALLAALPGRKAVVIASSDFSHYPTYDDAHLVDGATLAAIEAFDSMRVRKTIDELMAVGVSNLATCACGKGPILVTMQVARGLGAETVTVLRYANSGDSPQGDRERVVGYGAVMLWRYEPLGLTEAQREDLLSLARTTIETHLKGGGIPDYEADDPALARRSGAFVTLKERGELRGCIGHTWADQPLYQTVQETAVSAATGDPRFPPLTPEELAGVTVEISILSPFRRVTDVEQVQVGTHGLMIFAGGGRGLLLPQVPVENGWDRDRFLEELCQKAGLPVVAETPTGLRPAGCWQEGATLYAFTAVVFGE